MVVDFQSLDNEHYFIIPSASEVILSFGVNLDSRLDRQHFTQVIHGQYFKLFLGDSLLRGGDAGNDCGAFIEDFDRFRSFEDGFFQGKINLRINIDADHHIFLNHGDISHIGGFDIVFTRFDIDDGKISIQVGHRAQRSFFDDHIDSGNGFTGILVGDRAGDFTGIAGIN